MIKTLLVAGMAFGLVLAAGAASAGQCSTEIDTLQKQMSSTDAGMGPTGTGQVAETGSKLHPPTDAMNKATDGKAASSEDVASQNQGAPTDAEAAQAGAYGTPADAGPSLEHARQLDQAGDEAGCMNEINKLKTHSGAQ
jgi:hypothetical protein